MKILIALATIVVIIVFFGLLVSLPVMLLWNGCFVGAIDGVNKISWLQSWGLMILFGLLFKSSVETKK